MADPSLGLIVVHWPMPHPPSIYNRSTQQLRELRRLTSPIRAMGIISYSLTRRWAMCVATWRLRERRRVPRLCLFRSLAEKGTVAV